MAIRTMYVEKKPGFDVEAGAVLADLRTVLRTESVTGVRLVNRYFVEHIDDEDFESARGVVFSEPAVDRLYDELPEHEGAVFAVEYLPGQFDQRADSAAQCVSLASGKERPLVQTARVYMLAGEIGEEELARIKRYLINPVESREASLSVPDTLETDYPAPDDVKVMAGFVSLDAEGLAALHGELGLAMDRDDLRFCQDYFAKEESRDPTLTEIRMIDTYWSDHCRHTTFQTELDQISVEDPEIASALVKYHTLRKKLYVGKNKPVTLMDLATIGTRELKARGLLKDLDESEEINACTVKIRANIDGEERDWLLLFKNETHNHPTEIEPFGGAATCLGGAIRDPLSGRSYVYQAMRVTGAGDPLAPVSETLAGKLPQRKITQTAAAGYSSYGNQIGLATGHVHELYHPGYRAKRMEIGAVVGAAPAENVRREKPDPGDIVILLGGRTGRDGCGGATGSSKSHTAASLEECGAEVQKGNPPEERKLQRLFRNPDATRLIKRCNDFGAGGVAVSIGELADGLTIDLDAVPKKYDGLDGTELAISESQERMSVVVEAKDAARFIELAGEENLEATIVAEITQSPRLRMNWRGKTIVDLARSFLDSNGAAKHMNATIANPGALNAPIEDITGEQLTALFGELNVACQKGLVERFDSTIGAGTVLMPFGGKRQLTPAQAMAAKLPVWDAETDTCSVMGWGYDLGLAMASPYYAGKGAVIESVAKVIAAGGSLGKCWLTFQEYFERLGSDPARWGKPAAALLGALETQLALGVGAIGGKDSMSGTFEDIDVPPTIVSFAVSVTNTGNVISPEFKKAGSKVYLLAPAKANGFSPDFGELLARFGKVEELIATGEVVSAWAVDGSGTAGAIPKLCFGNGIGFKAAKGLDTAPLFGGFVLEAKGELAGYEGCLLGETVAEYTLTLASGEVVDLAGVQKVWEEKLAPVFPWDIEQKGSVPDVSGFTNPPHILRAGGGKVARPRVIIPAFPGTNCEDDTARAFRRAGAEADVFIVRNRTAEEVVASVEELARRIAKANILAIPGGFSGGDEPDGSAKFIVSFFRNPVIAEKVMELLTRRDGLALGICNGFQALIKLGLLPYGEIRAMEEDAPTLTYNRIGRHQSMLTRTRIVSNKSPWLMNFSEGDVFTVPVSHGEGRFVADEAVARELLSSGQVATVYVDGDGNPTQNARYNPNNSVLAVEGLLSPDGRVLGKMAHSERAGDGLYKNVPGDTNMDIFRGAVEYYL